MVKLAWAALAVMAIAGTGAAYEAWVAGAGPSTSLVVTNMEPTTVQAHLVHPGGHIDELNVPPGAQEVVQLSARGNEPGVHRIGHRLVASGNLAANVVWQGQPDTAASGILASSSLGTHHRIFPLQGTEPETGESRVAIVATRDGTNVHVQMKHETHDGQALQPAGSAGDYLLDAFDALVLEGKILAGTNITSDRPVAVFDHRLDYRTGPESIGTIAEQVPPLHLSSADTWTCMQDGVEHTALMGNLQADTQVLIWETTGSSQISDMHEVWEPSSAPLDKGGATFSSDKPIQVLHAVSSPAHGGPGVAYAPAEHAWHPKVDAVIPPHPGADARVLVVHKVDEVPSFTSGGPIFTKVLGGSNQYACSVSSPIPAGVHGVRVEAPSGVAAWVWSYSDSKGSLAAQWPPCLAAASGMAPLTINGVFPSEEGLALVWSDPEADCESSSFRVERSREGGPFQSIAQTSTPVHMDRTVETCVDYQYRVSRLDGTGTAQTERVQLPDEHDCGPPPDDTEPIQCPSLDAPIVLTEGGVTHAELIVRDEQGELWDHGVAFSLHVLSDAGIEGEVDWNARDVVFRTFGVPTGSHAVDLFFEPFAEECPFQEYTVLVTVAGGTGPGNGQPPGGDDGSNDGGGPPGGLPPLEPEPEYVCPVVATRLLENQSVVPGDTLRLHAALAEGGNMGYTWMGGALGAFENAEFDAGTGDMEWNATEPGLYKGTINLVTSLPRCDDEISVRVLVQEKQEEVGQDATDQTTDEAIDESDDEAVDEADGTGDEEPAPCTSCPDTGAPPDPPEEPGDVQTDACLECPSQVDAQEDTPWPFAWTMLALLLLARRHPIMRR